LQKKTQINYISKIPSISDDRFSHGNFDPFPEHSYSLLTSQKSMAYKSTPLSPLKSCGSSMLPHKFIPGDVQFTFSEF